MKLKFYLLTSLFLFAGLFTANAQLSCDYRLEMYDSFGDGWNGSSIDVNVGGTITNYTVTFDDNNGDFNIVNIPVNDGDDISLTYAPGAFEGEVTYFLYDAEDGLVFNDGPNPLVGVSFEGTASCPTCPKLDIESVQITQTPGGFDVTWDEGQVAGTYIIEYGALGFTPGSGTTATSATNSFSLTDEEEGSLWDIYLSLDCGGGDVSTAIGPIFVQAGFLNPPSECAYTLELFDSFGDGWNGAQIEVIINGQSEFYTVTFNDNNGDFNIVSFPVQDGGLITLNYTGGTFENEVTYNLLDSDGIVVFSDGPNPATGQVFQGVASCPPCPLPIQSSFIADPIGANTAVINWAEVAPAESYTLEYGAGCIEPGAGTEIVTSTNSQELTGLQPSTLYTYYLTGDCGAEGLSNTAGPFFFETSPACFAPSSQEIFLVQVNDAAISIVPNPNTDTYIIEYGPVGFALGGGQQSDPFMGNLGVVNGLEPNTEYQYFVYGDCDGVPSEALGPFTFTTDLPCPSAVNLNVESVGENSADISWEGSVEIDSYTVEYGPQGFELGTGMTSTTDMDNITLTGLNSGIAYDVYVISNCDGDGSGLASLPLTFATVYVPTGGGATNGAVCTYTLAMFDSFGDGWNGSSLNVVNGSFNETYTITFADNNGDFNIVEFDVTSGEDLILTYSPGTFENEVTYILFDSEGTIVFQDGPNPLVGEAFNAVALCPPCSGITDGEVTNIRAEDATLTWLTSGTAQSYNVEWGPVGFTLGTGTSETTTDTTLTITGLTSNTWYNAYITPDCGDDGLGRPFGPLAFQTYIFNDVGIVGFDSPVIGDCLFDEEDISVLMQNFGQNPQQLIPFFYSLDFMNAAVNNPVDGLYTGVIGKDSIEVIDFDNPIDFSTPGYYYFEAWTELEGDEDPSNDTLRYEFVTAIPLPLSEKFEQSNPTVGLPDGWTTTAFAPPIFEPGVGFNQHGVTSNVIGDQFFGFFADTLQFTIPRYGLMENSSVLTFDYRFVTSAGDGSAGTYFADEDDEIKVLVSTDCGETYEEIALITQGEFVTTFFKEASISLGEYAGEAINIRFQATNSGSGAFFVDIDNINIAGCPESMFIQMDQSSPESFGSGNGTLFAQPTFGLAPFSFEWSSGDNTALAEDLGFTSYTVTITDANGCTDMRTFTPMLTDTEDPTPRFEELSLAPNPTTGITQLQVSLPQATDINVQVFDLAGRLLQTHRQDSQAETTFDLDMSDQATGMYLVRVQAADAVKVMKLAVGR